MAGYMMGTSPSPLFELKSVKLNDLLEAFTEERGLGRLVVMSSIRQYLSNHNVRELMEEINLINRDDHLNILLGAGLRGVLYYTAVARKAELMGI